MHVGTGLKKASRHPCCGKIVSFSSSAARYVYILRIPLRIIPFQLYVVFCSFAPLRYPPFFKVNVYKIALKVMVDTTIRLFPMTRLIEF